MKLCTFQGTFNPLHNGHVKMANYVCKNLDYDSIIFIPAYKPPHKNYDKNISKERYNIVKAYTDAHPEFSISDIEYKREKPSYTYDTITELMAKYECDGKIGFIIGQDAFEQIESWYETDKLKNLLDFIVFLRENSTEPEKFKYLKDKGYNYKLAKHERVEISSTHIRELLKETKNYESISELVPKEVKEYISEHALYI